MGENEPIVTVDPNAPHDEDCGFWHGFACRCKPDMEAALYRDHCHECDFMHGHGYSIGRLPAPVSTLREPV